MQLKRIGLLLLVIMIIGAVFGWKAWQQQTVPDAGQSAQIKGPAVILFRGDDSPSCQAIDHLVAQAATRYGKQIAFVQRDWSADEPLIKKYQIRFLPTVVFVDEHNKEVTRIIGESPAVQQKLAQTLARLEQLLRP
jgi:thioredoxin 1